MGNFSLRGCTFIGIIALLAVGKASASDSFYYETDSYRYELNNKKEEVFSFITKEGTQLDTFTGGGTYQMIDEDTGFCNVSTSVLSYESAVKGGVTSLRVDYEMVDGTTSYNIYTFYDDYVKVQSYIDRIDVSRGYDGIILKRDMQSDYTKTEKKLATDWVYPQNGDFPYKQADSIVTTYEFQNGYKLFSFVRGKDAKRQNMFEEYGETDIPVPTENGTVSSYQLEYDLVFEHTSDGRDADYFALFEGRASEFAARVTTNAKNESNVAIYETDELILELAVDNLLSGNLEAEVSYTVYDYDGEEIAKAEETLSLEAEQGSSLPIEVVSDKNGIFYLDYEVKSKNSSYRELFSFILTEPYEYQHTRENLFGISGVRFGEYEPNDDTVWIMEQLGFSNARICFSEGDYVEKEYDLLIRYLKKLREKKVRIDGQYLLLDGWRMPGLDTAEELERELDEALAEVSPYLDSCEVGNEYNLYAQNQGIAQAMQDYRKIYFEPGLKIVKQKYGIPLAGAGIGLSRADWFEASVSSGLFSEEDILKTHAYGFPYSPDYTSDAGIDLVVESAFARTRSFLEKNGDKTWYVDEVGYPTTAKETSGIGSGNDLRSQADYLVRALSLGAAYGADSISVYNLYDQLNLFKGVSDSNKEFNFGIFYYPDYYGRILPKPSAAALGNMTRLLDGAVTGEEIMVSSDTVRAFCMYDKSGEAVSYVAWSTGSRLSNDCADAFARTPNLPWENQWQESEKERFWLQDKYAEVTDIMGNTTRLPITNGYVEVELSGSPCFIRVK